MPRKLTRPRPKQAARLVELRKSAGLSQYELARLIGEPQANIAYWERSKKPPRSDVLLKLASVLGVSVEAILNGNGSFKRRGGPTGKLQKIFNEVSKLPKRQQEKVIEFVFAFVKQQK